MRDFDRSAGRLATALALLLLALSAPAAEAAITATPSTETVTPGGSTGIITLNLTFPPGPSVTYGQFTGLPPGASVIPNPVLILIGVPANSASVTFEIATTTTTPPGTYPIAITTTPDIQAGVGSFVLVVAAPDFQASVSPNPVQAGWGATSNLRVVTTPLYGFSTAITYTVAGLPSGITVSGSQTVTPPYPPADFQITVAPRTPPGPYPATIEATWAAFGIQSRSIPITVIVLPPTLALAFDPPSVTPVAGGAAVPSALELAPGNGYVGSPALSWGAIPPGLEVTPQSLPSPSLPPGSSIPITVRAAGAAPGTYQITARAVDAVARVDALATLVVTVAPPPDATLSVTPPALTVTAGRSGTVTVSATGLNGFAGTLDVAAPNIAGVAFSPASFALRGGESREVTIRPAVTTPPGVSAASFTATSSSLSGTRSASLMLTVTPPPPEITSVTPPALTAGSSGVAVRLVGQYFRPGATVTFTPPGPIVTSAVVGSSTLVSLVVETPAATQVGQYRVELRNTDGATAGAPILVAPPNSLGAPLSVPTAAIVFPRPWASVTTREPLFPRAVLATTGVGTIVGTWRLDGVPFDQFVVAASGGYPVEVTAKMPVPSSTTGEHRLELVVEQPQQLATEPVPIVVSVESNSELRILDPKPGASVSPSAARFRWTIVPGATGYEIELASLDGTATRTVRLSDSRWNPEASSLARLGTGHARVRVAAVFPGEVKGRPTEWREFELAPASASGPRDFGARVAERRTTRIRLVAFEPEEPAADPPAAAAVAQPLPSDWALTLLGSASSTDEDVPSIADAARLQITTAGDLETTSYFTKWTGDLSGRKDLDPEYDTEPENRAWQLELGLVQSGAREELRAGYNPPEFLDQSEFLAAGLARGGVLGKVSTPFGRVSLYDTFHEDAAGAVSAYDLSQRVSGAAWEAPGDTDRSLLRVFGLRAQGQGTADHPETEAEALGLLWRYVQGPGLTFVVEAAHGTLDGVTQPGGQEYDGYGYRVGLTGMRGTFSWNFNLRDVDADLMNPANLGLSMGGVPDRTGGDLTLGKTFGATSLSLQLRSQSSGELPDGSGGDVDERNATLMLAAPLGGRVVASATAMVVTTEGDGNVDYGLPASDRTMLSAGVTFSETFGALSLSEALTWQDLSDDVTSAFDSTVTSASLTAGGMLGTSTLLSALLSGTRSESPEPVGTTDLWIASLQPTVNWARASMAFTPRLSYTRVESELGGTTDSELYGIIAQWSPPWLESFFNLQLGAEWSRASVEGMPSPSFDQRLVASLTLRWGLSRAQLASAPPAALPAYPPASAASSRAPATLAR